MVRESKTDHDDQLASFTLACNRIHQTLEIPYIIRATVAAAVELVDAEAGAAGLLVDRQMAFSECLKHGVWESLPHRFDPGQGVVGHLMKSGRPYLTTDTSKGPSVNPEIDGLLDGVCQLIGIPVHGKEEGMLGCILVFNRRNGQFNVAEQNLLERLASITSIAIDHAIRLSESQRIEADLQKSVATYRTLVEQIPAITYIATLDRSQTLFVSPQIEETLGFSQESFLNNANMWEQQLHHEDRERVLSEVRQSYTKGTAFHSEYRICTHAGKQVWFNDAAAVVRENDQALYLQGVMYDISERKEFENRLLRMAHFDQLTGLANRALFHDRLNQAIAQAKRHKTGFALLYLDLDGFKAVNDSQGHQAGDELLVEASRHMQRAVRAMDTVARMGGDEFTIILSETDSKRGIELVANKLLQVLAEPYQCVSPNLRVSASIGIAVYPDDRLIADELITAADNAMYHAKQEGRNCYRFCTAG